MTPLPNRPARYAAAAFGLLAAALLVTETWRAFSALAQGSLVTHLPEGVSSTVVFVGLCWATRLLIGQPLFGRPRAVQIGPAPSGMRSARRAF